MRVFQTVEEASTYLQRGSVVTIGNYDGIHLAHQSIIKELSRQAQRLQLNSAMVTFDPHPSHTLMPQKAPQLLTTTAEKIRLLEKGGLLDVVVVLHFDRELAEVSATDFLFRFLLSGLGMKSLVIGFNHAFGNRREGDLKFLRAKSPEYGFELTALDPVLYGGEVVNSSRVRSLISEGKYNDAIKLLGHPLELSGPVVRGKGMGKKLGYPTINVKLPGGKLIPNPGVYAAYSIIGSEIMPGMMYIAEEVHPDYDIEMNLFDFEGDLYGKRVSTFPTSFIRPTIKFGRESDLVDQIAKDEMMIRKLSDTKLIKE